MSTRELQAIQRVSKSFKVLSTEILTKKTEQEVRYFRVLLKHSEFITKINGFVAFALHPCPKEIKYELKWNPKKMENLFLSNKVGLLFHVDHRCGCGAGDAWINREACDYLCGYFENFGPKMYWWTPGVPFDEVKYWRNFPAEVVYYKPWEQNR